MILKLHEYTVQDLPRLKTLRVHWKLHNYRYTLSGLQNLLSSRLRVKIKRTSCIFTLNQWRFFQYSVVLSS